MSDGAAVTHVGPLNPSISRNKEMGPDAGYGSKNMTGYDWTCQACGNKEAEILSPVLEKLPGGEQKQIMVCEKCEPRFERVRYLRRRFDEQLLPVEEMKWWTNDLPLDYTHNHLVSSELERELAGLDEQQRFTYLLEHALDPARIPLDDFPLVEDFEVCLETLVARHNVHKMLIPSFDACLSSPSPGYLGSFSGHIQSDDLCRSDFVIPHGDFTLPFYDLDQGISQLIFEDESFVYIIGRWDERTTSGYKTWFKVTQKRYYSAWEDAIQQSRKFHGRDTSS